MDLYFRQRDGPSYETCTTIVDTEVVLENRILNPSVIINEVTPISGSSSAGRRWPALDDYILNNQPSNTM